MIKLLREQEIWGADHENAFQQIKQEMVSNRIPIWYDPQLRPRFQPMFLHTALELSCSTKVMIIGNQ